MSTTSAVVLITFDFMQDSMDPSRGRLAFVLLHDFMSGIPFAGHSQVDRLRSWVSPTVQA